MQATVIIKANATTNHLINNIATMAQDLHDSPFHLTKCLQRVLQFSITQF